MTFSASPNVFGLHSLAQGLFLEVFSRIYQPRPEGDLGAELFEIAG